MPHPLHSYFTSLRELHRVGTPETSAYPVLQALFDEVGKGLKPRVRCVIHPQSQGAGIPDGGFFTAEQLQEGAGADVLTRQVPTRGVMEVKGTSTPVDAIIGSDQAEKYLRRYGLLLATNYYDFALLRWDAAREAVVKLECFRLAPDAATWWASDGEQLARDHGTQFLEFVRRVLLTNAPLTRNCQIIMIW